MKFRYQLNLGALFPLVLLISLAEAKATQNITVTGNFYYVVVTSLGTNWTVVPEYNSNLSSSGWASVPGYTNTYSNGTNTTSFDRLEAICGNNVFLRIRQELPSGQ